MKDVATRAGVGLKTVSRVVNGEPGVTAETADRVRIAIQALGFRRNDSARVLRKGRTASIGLILDDVGDPFYSSLARAVEDVTDRNGSLLLLGSSNRDPEREKKLALTFCARRVDGLIIVPASTDHSYLLPEAAAGVATVFAGRPPRLIEADAVLTDGEEGARHAVGHLTAHGHRAIGYLGDVPDTCPARLRLEAYRDAVAGAGLPSGLERTVAAPADPSAVGTALGFLASGPGPATAVLCGNSRISVIVSRIAAARGLRLAVVGLDDFEFAELLAPGLTVVAAQPAHIGRTAAEMLFGRLSGDQRPPLRAVLPARLVIRGSGEIAPP